MTDRIGRIGWIFALALVITALDSHVARACSCVPPRLQRIVVPADGASGFPTDGSLRVFLTGFPEPLRSALASEYRLRDASGALVPLDARVVGTRLDLRPRAPLAPSTRYTLEGVFAYDAAGVQVSDTERWRAAMRGGASLRGAWFPVASFETGAGPSGARRASPQITAARVHFAMGGGDCGPGVGLSTDLQLPASVSATDVLELRVGGTVVDTLPAEGAAHAHASDLLCNPDPVTLRARSSMNVELVLLDAAGTELGSSGRTRARGAPRFELEPSWHRHRRSPRATPEVQAAAAGWSAIAITTASASRDPGPTGCPHGLEITARREAAPTGSPWMYEAHSALTADGRSAWMALADPSSGVASALRVSPDGSVTSIGSGIAGHPAIGGSGSRGPYFLARTYTANSRPQSALHALATDGRSRWTQPIAGDGEYFRIASGAGRVLVSWLNRAAPLDRDVAWAVYDEASGAPVGAITVTSHSAHTNGGLASAFVRDRFFVAWPSQARGSSPSVMLATVSLDGAERSVRDLGVTGHGPMDLATAGLRVALVTESDGEIAWHLLDESGALVRGPVVVSAGVGGRDNRKPRVAWNGEVFAVAWETHPSARTYVTAVDEGGRVAPALAFAPGQHTCTVGIAATGRDFVGAYTLDPYESARAITTTLRCRASAPAGAPQRIQPAP